MNTGRSRFLVLVLFCSISLFLPGCMAKPAPAPSVPAPSAAPVQTETPHTRRTVEGILKLANNTESYDDLIQTTYPMEELIETLAYLIPFYRTNGMNKHFKGTLLNIDQLCPIECIRKIGEETYYAVWKSNDGMLFFQLFKPIEGEYTAVRFWILGKPLTRDDFKTVTPGVTTTLDVTEIDPYQDGYVHTSQNTPFPSVHYTVDGDVIIIHYDWQTSRVTDIEYISVADREGVAAADFWLFGIYPHLLPMDREALGKLASKTEMPAPLPHQKPHYGPLASIMARVNNTASFDALIRTPYVEEGRGGGDRSILEADAWNPIECLRLVNDKTCYTVSKSEEGALEFVLYRYEDFGWSATPGQTWVIDRPHTLSDFAWIVPGKSTCSDVRKFDAEAARTPLVNHDGTVTKAVSLHQTVDGYIVAIYYPTVYGRWEIGEEILSVVYYHSTDIEEIHKILNRPFPWNFEAVYPYLLPIDREAVNALAKTR